MSQTVQQKGNKTRGYNEIIYGRLARLLYKMVYNFSQKIDILTTYFKN